MTSEAIRQWYVVYSKPHKEEHTQFHLQQKGLEVFFPRLRLSSLLPKQRQLVPLFPSYLFVHLRMPEEHSYALWCPGVKRLVSFNGVPAPLDEVVVAFLKQRATLEGILEAQPNLLVGQKVEVTGGPFAGLSGIIEHPPDGKGRIRLLMSLLNRELKVEIPMHHLKSRWTIKTEEKYVRHHTSLTVNGNT